MYSSRIDITHTTYATRPTTILKTQFTQSRVASPPLNTLPCLRPYLLSLHNDTSFLFFFLFFVLIIIIVILHPSPGLHQRLHGRGKVVRLITAGRQQQPRPHPRNERGTARPCKRHLQQVWRLLLPPLPLLSPAVSFCLDCRACLGAQDDRDGQTLGLVRAVCVVCCRL